MASSDVPAAVVESLVKTRPWLKVMGVLFTVIFALAAAGTFVALVALKGRGRSFMLVSWAPFLLVLAAHTPGMLALRRYGAAIASLQRGGGMAALEEAARSQRSFWKRAGIVNIVVTVLFVVSFLTTGTLGRMIRNFL